VTIEADSVTMYDRQPHTQLFIITGYSGAGKSVALKALEDVGCVSMDNIPLSALGTAIQAVAMSTSRPIAVCSDVRSPDFSVAHLLSLIEQWKTHYECRLVFLACDDDVLLARYNATKHRHPLHVPPSSMAVSIQAEKGVLDELRHAAHHVINTSDYTPHHFKQHLLAWSGLQHIGMLVHLMSFSYQRGLPANADMVCDVRFLRNPYYEPALRHLTGRDALVAAYVAEDNAFPAYLQALQEMLTMLIPLYEKEGKSYFTLAIGCTGGRHRSVYMVETLGHSLQAAHRMIEISHRESPL
jgi:RNase adapter protein RapZ